MTDFVTELQEALGTAYVIERELPLGGVGRIFLATETASGRAVSVQALPPDLAARVDLGRFRAAVDQVSRLRHGGVLPLVAAGAREHIVYCVWPHPRGESLRYRLIRDGGLDPDDTMQVLHDVADALAHGHARGVCHGDLRPDNIYISNGRAAVAEFGIRSALNAALGSDSALDARADVHALAVAGQQMLAGRHGPAAAAVARALSIDPSEQFADAAAFRDALGAPPSARRNRRRWGVGAVVLLVAVIAGIAWLSSGPRGVLDPNLIAVSPFDVLDAEHAVWREGLVTVLSANLDGAGPLHTVSPSVVVRMWKGRADAASAVQLARRTGARLGVFGRVVRTGRDSMRLTAALVDAVSGGTLAELQLTDPDGRLDRLADSLTVALLRELSQSRAISAVRRASLGAGSLPALKAFLEGEQRYRRSEWDSALADYQRAIALDSSFALALYRAGLVVGWTSTSGDSLSTAYLTRAAAHNHGLPPRDSMLVVAESLTAALDEGPAERDYWALYRRMYATTASATRRYPRDAEVWYEFGDVRYHFPAFSTLREMKEAFDRSIALDSAFAPAYIHPVELAAQLEGRVAARRYVRRYLDLRPADIYADGMTLTGRLLDPRQALTPSVQAVLDTASSDLLIASIQSFRGWADSLETAVRLARLLVNGVPGRAPPADGDQYAPELANALAYFGHLREAEQFAGEHQVGWVAAAAAWMRGADDSTVADAFAASLADEPLYPRGLAAIGAPWFAQRQDSVSLRRLASRADSLERAGDGPLSRAQGAYYAAGARALLALVRGDTTAAIAGLLALPDSACGRCVLYTMELARLLDARHQDEDAAVLLAKDSPGFVFPTDGLWALYRARLAARQGDPAAAREHYQFVRNVWLQADPELQPFVQEARTALARRRD